MLGHHAYIYQWYVNKKQKEAAYAEAIKFQNEIYPLSALPEPAPAEKGVEKLYKIINTINDKVYVGLTEQARNDSKEGVDFYKDMLRLRTI